MHDVLGRGVGRLGGADHVQGGAVGVVPGQAVFRLHRHVLDRLAVVLAREDAHAVTGLLHLVLDAFRLGHQRAEGGVIVARPVHALLVQIRPDGGVLHRRELVLAIGVLALHAHEARGHVGLACGLRGFFAKAEDGVVEAQARVGDAELLVVVPDGQGHRMAEHGRELALLEEELAVEAGLRHAQAVGFDRFGVDEHVRLVVAAQHGQVQTQVGTVSARNVQGQGVGLLGRPALHVPGAQVDGKDLLAGDLGQTVTAVVELVASDPLGFLPARGNEHLGKRVLGRTHARNDAQGSGSLHETAPAYFWFEHRNSPDGNVHGQELGLRRGHVAF